MKTIFSSLIILMTSSMAVLAQEIYEIPDNRQTRWSSFENPSAAKGNGGRENRASKGHAYDILEGGGSKVMLDYKGAGVVERIWLTVRERSPIMLRSMRLEMYWDNAATPAVSAPLGDFFGIGLGRKVPFESEFFSDPEGRSFNCNIPMPFKTAARIVIINDSKTPTLLFYDVDMTIVPQHEKPVYYFHAYWSRQNKTKAGKDFEVLPQVSGKGRFLGMNVGVIADSVYETSWWGEGEVKMFLDDDGQFPTLVGTGTEDYIGTGWGQSQYAHRYQGCPLADPKNRQWSFYRFHVPDPVFFQSQCRITFQQMGGEFTDFVRKLKKKGAAMIPVSVSTNEKFYKILDMNPVPDLMDSAFPQGWTNYYREDDVSATAYFYLDKPTHSLPSLANVAQRTVGLLDVK